LTQLLEQEEKKKKKKKTERIAEREINMVRSTSGVVVVMSRGCIYAPPLCNKGLAVASKLVEVYKLQQK
jgi:hypothetical protein